MEPDLAESSRESDSNSSVPVDNDSVTGNSTEMTEEGMITDQMIKEEEKIREELEEEEEKAAFRKKVTGQDKEQSFQRLLKLLSRSQLYATYLKEKMKEQQEVNNRKLLQEEQTKKKKMEKMEQEQKENVEQSVGRQTRGDPKLQSPSSLTESGGKKRGRQRSSPDNGIISNHKRKKLEDIKLNGKRKTSKVIEEEESAEEAEVPVDEEITKNISARQPELLVGGVMRDYQLEGFEWMKVLYENGINGILADEMGLGKTIQCISLVAHLVGKGIPGPYLIVAPLSTLPNWYSEFKRFTPKIPVLLYHGDKATREILKRKISRTSTVRSTTSTKPVVLTSYDLAIKDAAILKNHLWRYLIVDEGHRLKNFKSRLCLELKRFPAANRLLLTGTPLQNNLSELWSLLNFLLPEIFDNLSVFESWFDVETMSAGQSDETIIAQEQEKHIISKLHEILNPFLLRRTKADVELNLPPKKEVMVCAPLTSTQQLFYQATLDKSITNLLKERSGAEMESPVIENGRRSCSKQIDYSIFNRDLTEKELKLLDATEEDFKPVVSNKNHTPVKLMSTQVKLNTRNIMACLRKICNHPYLLEYPLDPETGSHRVDEEMIRVCGKLRILDCMLPALKDRGHKVLLFSQMTSLLNILEDYCSIRKHTYVRLDGNTNLGERQEMIRAFNGDPKMFLFLISTRAGGLGINLTAADTVIIYDSDWNPQSDLQAQDRCHRFGQTKPVVVYRLVTANTIDEKIVIRAAAKRRLEKMIMKKGRFSKYLDDNTSTSKSAFSVEELQELLKSTDHSGIIHTDCERVLTPEQLEKLLDRSDLLKPKTACDLVPVPQEQDGVFKVLDVDENS